MIHRIVGIEEPGGAGSGRRFTTQGDAVAWPDGEAVEYAQLRGIYRGERVSFLGSLVLFLQSPAGWLCILLMAFAAVASPRGGAEAHGGKAAAAGAAGGGAGKR